MELHGFKTLMVISTCDICNLCEMIFSCIFCVCMYKSTFTVRILDTSAIYFLPLLKCYVGKTQKGGWYSRWEGGLIFP